MTREAATRPVAETSRTMFPQTSAHWALYGFHEESDVGQLDMVSAPMAADRWGDYPGTASKFLHGKFAVEHVRKPSWVKCSWDQINMWCAGGNGCCPRKTDEG
jgi:hypothetical protein